eukprot:TRINITY_DN54672_c0_g1_i1.p1 TRINITY_DN54672_c0_g1~~TRINITY_DN54672_c0_g1_i1.p1  ORF type:complete len:503 (-),score=148.92 TRINITY_DN54672_c0_g1_i1:321-1829(-)
MDLLGGVAGPPVPDAARIAAILRSSDPWPQTQPSRGLGVAAPAEGGVGSGHALDFAHRLASQQRQLLSISPACGGAGGACAEEPISVAHAFPAQSLGAADQRTIGLLAERTAVLCGGLQRRLEQTDARLDSKADSLEARVAACEERVAAQERRLGADDLDRATGAAFATQEARACVERAMAEVRSEWDERHLRFEEELRARVQEASRGQLQRLEELGEHYRRATERLEQAEGMLDGHEGTLRVTEEQLQGLLAQRDAKPPWYDQLEAALGAIECRIGEHQAVSEARLGRFGLDVDALRRQTESIDGIRDEVLAQLDQRFGELQGELELEREHRREAAACGATSGASPRHRSAAGDREVAKRLDDAEAKAAALRVRVDAHDGRFGSLAERLESARQQAVEVARQVASEQREEILSEADCQLRILRQRVETLGELCEELMLRQASAPRGAAAAGGVSLSSSAACSPSPAPAGGCGGGPAGAGFGTPSSLASATLRGAPPPLPQR